MKRRTALTAIGLFLIIIGMHKVSHADPLSFTGNSVNQNSIGNTGAALNASAISNSTLRNGAAGNTFNATGNIVSIANNNINQRNVGNHTATIIANSVSNSSVENHAAGNNITLF